MSPDRKNGIIREVRPDGSIAEYQVKDGKRHGFFRWITYTGAYDVKNYRDGKEYGYQEIYAHNDYCQKAYTVDSDGGEWVE